MSNLIDNIEQESIAKKTKVVAARMIEIDEATAQIAEELKQIDEKVAQIKALEAQIEESKRSIDIANSEHSEEIEYINKLRETLGHAQSPIEPDSLRGMILSVLPHFGVRFTFDDIYEWLLERYPDDDFNYQSARMVLHRIYKDGGVIRVRKTGKSTFVVAGSKIETGRFHDMTAVEAAEEALALLGQPSSVKTIAETLMEHDFDTDRTVPQIIQSMSSQLRKKPRRFIKVGKNWDLHPSVKEEKQRPPAPTTAPTTTKLIIEYLATNPDTQLVDLANAVKDRVLRASIQPWL